MPAEADPELLLRLAKVVADIYSDAHRQVLQVVARRLSRGITEPGWAEAKLLEVGMLRGEAQRIVELLNAFGTPAIIEAFDEAFDEGVRRGAADLAELGVDVSMSPKVNRRAVEALARDTLSMARTAPLRILRDVDDVYRAVVSEASLPGVVTGTQTRRQAAQRALDRFADRGVGGFVDRAGRRWQLESYVEQAVRTGAGRAQVAGTLDRFSAAGRDLVIVSDAPQECAVCRRWEGKVLSTSGTDTRFPSLAEATRDGLLHNNCRHRLGAYIEGRTKPFGHTADPEGDAARQQQRYLERGVRRWKRREAVALDEDAAKAARAKVAEWRGRLAEHVDANDLKRLRYREQIGRAI